MVSSVILEYGGMGEVHNNYTSESGIEVKPEIQNFDFLIDLRLRGKHA